MTRYAANGASNVEGRDIRGNIVTLKCTNPEQLSLFQTFLPEEDKYSNTIELYDAIPKYYSNKQMGGQRKLDTYLPALCRAFVHNRPSGAPLRHALFLRDRIVAHWMHTCPV
jgi:hypothetical protein